jgi:hypothetical protein
MIRYLIPDPPDFFEQFEQWTGRLSPLSSVVEAFRSNLRAARLVGVLPYQLVNSGVRRLRLLNPIPTATQNSNSKQSTALKRQCGSARLK